MRSFIFVCSPLLVLVAACASAPAPKVQPSILDVLDRSTQQSPVESQYAGGSKEYCPTGTVAFCVAQTRAGLKSNCSCVDSGEALGMIRGNTRF